MSGAKDCLENIEQCRRVAYELLMKIGAIDTCRGMHNFYYNTYKYGENELYAIVTNKLKEQYPDITAFPQFHKCVYEIISEAAESADACPMCQKYANE